MNFSQLDKFMSEMPARGFPGCEIAITYEGSTVYHRAFGYSDHERTRPASKEDLYWIFSTTKIVTLIATMKLVEEGKLSVEDPVSKYIPEYANVKIKNPDGSLSSPVGEIKIWHLFTMTGGLTYDLRTPSLEASINESSSTLDVIRALAKDPIMFEPGTHYLYSLCHDVLAGVCEIITGMRFSDYLNKLIFTPLELKSIGFRPTEEQKARFAAMYSFEPASYTAKPIPCYNEFILLKNYDSGGAGLFSNVNDYIKIITSVAMADSDTGYKILKPETVKMMQKNLLCDEALKEFRNYRNYGYGWGLGGRVHMNPTASLSPTSVGEFGWDSAGNALTFIDADKHIALFYVTHVRNSKYGYCVVHPEIRRLAYEGLFGQ